MNQKLSVFLFVSSIVILAGACANNGDDRNVLLLDSFEGELSKKTVDYGSAANSSLNVTASKESPPCGKQAIFLTYDLAKDGYLYCARGHGLDVPNALWQGPAPEKIDWAAYAGFSLQVKGTKAGQIAFDIKDAGGEMWRYIMDDNAEGWQEIIIPFDQFKARGDWQPSSAETNKKLDFPIDSFQFEPKTIGSGVVSFDCVSLVKK